MFGKFDLVLRVPLLFCSMFYVGLAFAETLLVPGNANPHLAGRVIGYTCCNGDTAGIESPIAVSGVQILGGSTINFAATGSVSFVPGDDGSGNNPDGTTANVTMINFGDGISAPTNIRWDALMGVFLGPDDLSGTTTPPVIDFASDFSFATLSPTIGQIFFIGDGLTSSSYTGDFSGAVQDFIVPLGATRLFLGTADGQGWFNNSGMFVVEVTFENADSDSDSVPDQVDNCIDVSNAAQTDTDGDDFGNACDPDYNNDCQVNFIDFTQITTAFQTTDANIDLNGDGVVNFLDISIFVAYFLGQPGPSALTSCQ